MKTHELFLAAFAFNGDTDRGYVSFRCSLASAARGSDCVPAGRD